MSLSPTGTLVTKGPKGRYHVRTLDPRECLPKNDRAGGRLPVQIQVVDTHTAGEPTRIAIAGIPPLRGKTLRSHRDDFRNRYDRLRKALLWEPRGHRDMFGAILTKPSTNTADLGVIFMDAGGYVNMCIHGSIGVLTAALELGLLPARPATHAYRLETPAGVVKLRAKFRDGRAEEVTVGNVPSFLLSPDVSLPVEGLGTVALDVAYAGNWFGLVNAERLGMDLERTPLRTIVDAGRAILREARRHIAVDDSLVPGPHEIGLIELYQDVWRRRRKGRRQRNVVVFGNGQYDRSPCGTGTSARMAALHARGELRLNEVFLSQSITGGMFKGTLTSEVNVGTRPAVVPEITGNAWITGFTQVVLDPRDPFSAGFVAAVD